MLSKSQIVDVNDTEIISVSVPEWGGDVGIKLMTGFEFDRLHSESFDENGKAKSGLRGRYLSLCLCDEKGEKLFTSPDELASKSYLVLQRLFDEASKHNRTRNQDIQDTKKN